VDSGCSEHIIHAAQAFQVDAVIVLATERLADELGKSVPPFVKLINVSGSGGVVRDLEGQREHNRQQSLDEYFNGHREQIPAFQPHRLHAHFANVEIMRIGAHALHRSFLPLGADRQEGDSAERWATKPTPVDLKAEGLLKRLLAYTVDNTENDVASRKVTGFMLVLDVDEEKGHLDLLSPQYMEIGQKIVLLFTHFTHRAT
jgi:hypothetical protein